MLKNCRSSANHSCEPIDYSSCFLCQTVLLDCKLHFAYGLADSSRNWYVSLSDLLIRVGCERNDLDTALFYHREDNKLNGMICLHDDDFLICGNTKFNRTKPCTEQIK